MADNSNSAEERANAREYGLETFVFLAIFLGFMIYIGRVMGVGPMFKTLTGTIYAILMETVLYICAICAFMGALTALFAEFGVVALAERLITPLMRPLYGMPGSSALGVLATFLSDNPAILTLAKDKRMRKYFRKYELPSLTNLGTAWGMGLIVCTFMIGLSSDYTKPVLCGLGGCLCGSIVSTRIMHALTKRRYTALGKWEEMLEYETGGEDVTELTDVPAKKPSVFSRVLNSILEGGKAGWEMCFAITPGVIGICTVVMILTFGPGVESNGLPAYTGAAYEGVALLPRVGNFLTPVTKLLFGFTNGANIAMPITSLGAVGAAIGLVPRLIATGAAGPNEIAVFTAIGMCWSGYLSTHVSMMEALGRRELIGCALASHTIGGLCAGTAAHYIFMCVA